MRRFGFWLGISILGFVVLANLVTFTIKWGVGGLVGLAVVVGAAYLVVTCSGER